MLFQLSDFMGIEPPELASQSQDDEQFNTSNTFYRVTASLVWHPLGWKKFTSWRHF